MIPIVVAHKAPKKDVPIIILTGYAFPSRIESARDNGITEYLIKPFTAESLAQRITHVINHPRDMVESPMFVGPDRRRKGSKNFTGKERRTRRKD